MAKNNQKCIRMSDEVLQYIEGFEGNGFNEKFENLVSFCMKEEDRKRAVLESLERRIDIYQDLSDISFQMRSLYQKFYHFRELFDSATERFDQINQRLKHLDI